jgi:hypothetical protein
VAIHRCQSLCGSGTTSFGSGLLVVCITNISGAAYALLSDYEKK